MDLASWRDTGDRFEWRGQQVFYQEEGEGEVIFLLHGFLNSSWIFKYIWPLLTEHYRVIAPDYIGFGYSSKPHDYNYGLEERADMIHALADLLDVKEYHIMATSFSVSVTQELLCRQLHSSPKSKISSVVFLNGVLFSDKSTIGLRQRLLLSPIVGRVFAQVVGMKSFKDALRRRVGKYSRFPEEMLDELYHLLMINKGRRQLYKLNKYVLERTYKQKKLQAAIRETDVPMQLIWGIDEGDQIAGIRIVNEYRRIKGDQYVVMLKDIGHYPMVEQPEVVIQYFTSFIDGLRNKHSDSVHLKESASSF